MRYAWIPIFLIITFLTSTTTMADDLWANSPYKGWAGKQEVMPAARPRFCQPATMNCSCCNGADIVKTQFRVSKKVGPSGYPEDEWWFLNRITNKWDKVPDDIIHWDEPTPTGEAVLFIYMSQVRCFFPPQLVPSKQ